MLKTSAFLEPLDPQSCIISISPGSALSASYNINQFSLGRTSLAFKLQLTWECLFKAFIILCCKRYSKAEHNSASPGKGLFAFCKIKINLRFIKARKTRSSVDIDLLF